MVERHSLMDGRLHIYRRENSRKWQCAATIEGKNWRSSTGEESIARAKDIAEDWYLTLRGKSLAGVIITGKTFKEASEEFIKEYEVMTIGERSAKYVRGIRTRLKKHLVPYFGPKPVPQITTGLAQDYRVHRATERKDEKTGKYLPPAQSTIKQEIVVLRLVLKNAQRKGDIASVPDLSPPYRGSRKISHRAWFSPEEYKQFYTATRERAKHPKKERWRGECETFHDYVLFMVNTGLRPDEASRLQFRDVAIVTDEATGERILEIEVRGKRGVGYCKSMPGAVIPFERLRKRKKPQPTDLIFGKVQRELLNAILDELNLKRDRDGRPRTAYSLRHTYICFRLMEGADIYQIAKNCRTSVEMIEKYYAAHIKNRLDAAAINIRKPKPKREEQESDQE